MRINQKQKNVIMGGLLLIVVMVLFPPWTYTLFHSSETHAVGYERPGGYQFIGNPSTPVGWGRQIDVTRLSFQIVMVLALTGIGVLAFRKEPNDVQDQEV